MKKILKLVFVTLALLLFSCKSVEFKVKRDSVKMEISNVLKILEKQNNRKSNLISSTIQFASTFNINNKSLALKVIENKKKLSKLNANFNNQKMTKKMINIYFQEQIELSKSLNVLFQEFDKNPESSTNRSYFDLRNAFEGNDNRREKTLKQYNRIIEYNSKYINYPKFDIKKI